MATFGNTPASSDFSQMSGSATNDSASAGNVGEEINNFVNLTAGPSLTTATAANAMSMTLTAGDWDVSGELILEYTGATQSGDGQASIGVTSATLANNCFDCYNPLRLTTTTCKSSLIMTPRRMSNSGSQTVYLVAQATFTAGTCKASGNLHARRLR